VTVLVLVPTLILAVAGILRREPGVDIIALLAMGGALLLGEFLAGAIIGAMLTGGRALERFAVGRARRELAALLERAPRTANRRRGGEIVTVDIGEIEVGDEVVVRSGEVVPVDGVLLEGEAVLDESALTGETRPVTLSLGSPVRSGGTNGGSPLALRVTARAEESTYAGILRLVSEAEGSKARFVRLADRYALGFLGLTLLLAGGAWLFSGDPVRALAVLVVATPCPLLLAAPAAIIAGVSRAARHGVVIKGGAPLETLARARVLLLDKTGTVTAGRPRVMTAETFGALPVEEVIRLAASLEQLSVHPFAPAVLAEARERGSTPSFPEQVSEEMGQGIRGVVDGRHVAVGKRSWVASGVAPTAAVRSVEGRVAVEGSSSVYVGIDGELAGALVLHDPIRTEAPRALRDLRRIGFVRIHMVTGDHPDVAELVGDAVGIDRVFAERTPAEKVEVVEQVRPEGITVMVGDGINDAPALALADVGVAMGARGATAASEAADVVLTLDKLEGLVLATSIARRTRGIALQSVFVGMGLSLVAMGAASLGYLAPVAGALLQEGIDVLVILNALRALGGGGLTVRRTAEQGALARHLGEEHEALRPRVEELVSLAGRLDSLSPGEARTELEEIRRLLETELLPHEAEEQETAFPEIRRLLGEADPTGPLIRTHQEIRRLARLFARQVERLPAEGPAPEDRRDLRRSLYGLHAILVLHFAQEDELYDLLAG
jgi:heavy metal translocating P-type ATPase